MSLAQLFYAKNHAKQVRRVPTRRPRRHRVLPRRSPLLFEPLEPRLLLSSSPLSYVAAAGKALDLTLRLSEDPGVPTIQLVDNTSTTQSVVAQQVLSETNQVIITGSDQDDRLKLDLTTPLPIPVTFDGLGGSNTLVGPDTDTRWNITGQNAGDVAGVVFADVENLIGGSGSDLFVLADGSSVGGRLDGRGGPDTVDASGRAVPMFLSRSADGSALLIDASTTVRTANIEDFLGADAYIDPRLVPVADPAPAAAPGDAPGGLVPQLPSLRLVDGNPGNLAGQVFYLDHDGASAVT